MRLSAHAYVQVHVVLSNLLPAYENGVPIATLLKLNSDVANSLPPLSEADRTTLSTTLPILGSALGSIEKFPTFVGDSDVDPDLPSLQEVCIGMLPGLTEFVLTADYDDNARSSAAMCMHMMLSLGNLGVKECPVKRVVEDLVEWYTSTTLDENAMIDWLNFLSLMVSCEAIFCHKMNKDLQSRAGFFCSKAWRLIEQYSRKSCAILGGSGDFRKSAIAIHFK